MTAAQGKIQHKTVKRTTFGHSQPLAILILEHFGGTSKWKEEDKNAAANQIAFHVFQEAFEKSARNMRPVGFKNFCNACQWIGRLQVSMFALRKYLGRTASRWRCVTCVWGALVETMMSMVLLGMTLGGQLPLQGLGIEYNEGEKYRKK